MPREGYTFSFKEVAAALVKEQGIHEGIWGVTAEFGIGAANMGTGPDEVRPTAIVPIISLGLQRFTKENSLSVNAEEVNPEPS